MHDTPHTPAAQNLIAIASGKGGVGKTWLAVTLAQLVARSGRRVLLFDGDIGLANVDVQLGLTPQRDLSSVIQGRYALKEVITRYEAGGFDIIAGRSGSANLASLPETRIDDISRELAALSRDYDVILLDLGAGVDHGVLGMAALASRCIVVVTDEPTSLTDAYAFIKLMQAGPPAPEMHIVINQAATQREGEATFKAISRACVNFLRVTPKLLGIIRRDNKVKEAIRAQSPLLSRAPQSTAATDAAAIAVRLMQK